MALLGFFVLFAQVSGSGAFADELTCTLRLRCRPRVHSIHVRVCLAAFCERKMQMKIFLAPGETFFFLALALISSHCGEKLVT